jgi:hypothetical protein
VPDGVSQVKLTFASGARRGLPVHDNVYMADCSEPVSQVSFTVADGTPATLAEGSP